MQTKPSLTRLMTASGMGTILEWYDFSLFAFFTPIIAPLYFPHENKLAALMLTYAIFAIGFLVRPLGAVIFGHMGDRLGRKKTLVLSILMMSLSTFCIGLLPTYSEVGLAAPILLIILRIFQGLSVGGESTGAVLFVIESYSEKNRGWLSATLWSMTGMGMLLGSLVGSITLQFPHHEIIWRIPFLLGILTGVIGYFLRQSLPESDLFKNAEYRNDLVKFPFLMAMTIYRQELFIIMGLYILSALITYLIFIFMPAYAANVIGMPLATTSLISTFGLLGVTLLVPLGGYFSDCWNRKNSLLIFAIGFAVLSYPLFQLISHGIIQDYIMAECCFVILAAGFQGAISAAVLEMLPTEVRYTVAALGYNISYSILGGVAPLLASYLVKITGDKAAPALCLIAGAVIAIIASSQQILHHRHKKFFPLLIRES